MLPSLFAYIGPGADLALVSSVIGLLFTLGTSALFIVLMPFRALMRRMRGANKPAEVEAPDQQHSQRRAA